MGGLAKDTLESAAAKKKKKKKEKKKEKAAVAADEKQNDTQGKGKDNKIPKHVREMQQRLARLKEEEERRKREEEETLRKEEEERLRQEELERLAEEKKRLKKEKEKAKLKKKKQEGKILTPKQKEEARRRVAMKKQILANAGGLTLSHGESNGMPAQRPQYQNKKSKLQPQSHVSAEGTETSEAKPDHLSEVNDVKVSVDNPL